MTDKPTGPIWVDMTDMLMDLPIRDLVAVANHALNRLDMRAMGEVFHEAGMEIGFDLVPKALADEARHD